MQQTIQEVKNLRQENIDAGAEDLIGASFFKIKYKLNFVWLAADLFLRLQSVLKTEIEVKEMSIDESVRSHSRGKDWVATIIFNPNTSKVTIKNIGFFLIIYVKCTIRVFNRPDTTFTRQQSTRQIQLRSRRGWFKPNSGAFNNFRLSDRKTLTPIM